MECLSLALTIQHWNKPHQPRNELASVSPVSQSLQVQIPHTYSGSEGSVRSGGGIKKHNVCFAASNISLDPPFSSILSRAVGQLLQELISPFNSEYFLPLFVCLHIRISTEHLIGKFIKVYQTQNKREVVPPLISFSILLSHHTLIIFYHNILLTQKSHSTFSC